MKRALQTIEQILSRDSISADALVNIMIKFRIVIEAADAYGEYPTLLLYCNWVAHPKLDKKQATGIVEQFNAAFLRQLSSQQEKWIADAVIEKFCMHLLHQEIIKFAKEFGIALHFLDNWDNWVKFAWALIEELLERPITISDPSKTRDAARKFEALSGAWDTAISRRNPLVSVKFGKSDNKYIWVIEMLNGAIFFGEMAIISQEMVDNYSRKSVTDSQLRASPTESIGKGIRFACGLILGLVLGISTSLTIADFNPIAVVIWTLTLATICAFLALKFGSSVWKWLAQKWRL